MLWCLFPNVLEAGTAKIGRHPCIRSLHPDWISPCTPECTIVCSFPGITDSWQSLPQLPLVSLSRTISTNCSRNDHWELNSTSFTCCKESHHSAPQKYVSIHLLLDLNNQAWAEQSVSEGWATLFSQPTCNPLAHFSLCHWIFSHLSFNALFLSFPLASFHSLKSIPVLK